MATKTSKKVAGTTQSLSDLETPKKSVKETQKDAELEVAKTRMMRMKKLYSAAAAGRRRYDWEWVVRNLYLRGFHFARYNRASSTFVLGTRTKVRIPINLMWAQARAIRNQVTSFRPKWEVIPDKPSEAATENAQWSGKLLDYLFEKLGLKRKLKEIVYHGLYTSIGIWQFDWDSAKKEVSISVVDPFDLFIDPNAQSLDEAQYVIKAIRKPLNYIKTHPIYGTSATEQNIKADPKLASSEYKEFLLKSIGTSGEGQSSLEDENEYTILYEAQSIEWQGDGTPKVRITTWTEDCTLPLRDELTKESEFNYEIFQADIQPLEIYGESWAKHLMPINRVLDALESNIFEYNHFFAKGRFVIDKGSGVRSIVNENGQIIEKNPGYTVTSLPLAPLPPTHLLQIQNMRQYMEDIGGLHEVSMGRIPTGVKSGVGIAELKQADASSQDDLVDALEDFLVRSAKKVFRLVADNYTSTKLAQVAGPAGQPEYFYTVGEKSPVARAQKKAGGKQTFGEMGLPIAIIGSDNEIRVSVGSWLAYTKQARQEELKDLFRLGAIDQTTLLQHLEFGDIKAITDRTRMERLIQLRQQLRPSDQAMADRQGVDDESLALAENQLMDKGTPEPVELEDDHEVHLGIHKEGMDKTSHPELYFDHMDEHIKLMEAAPTTGKGMTGMLAGMGVGGPGGAGTPPAKPVNAGGPGGGGIPPEVMAAMAQQGGGGGGVGGTTPAAPGPGLGGGIPMPPMTTGQ
jgi:hypothetical protein